MVAVAGAVTAAATEAAAAAAAAVMASVGGHDDEVMAEMAEMAMADADEYNFQVAAAMAAPAAPAAAMAAPVALWRPRGTQYFFGDDEDYDDSSGNPQLPVTRSRFEEQHFHGGDEDQDGEPQ
jgi:hypothetical protein